ncbi:restriction endonuclease subunit S [Mongoliitalea daihaiensis]|uniref:restriction endonuclease subunit S n=1 Tax=Mongoliitalea daihaiensis TaxID=2782006 RepID=UPI001F36A613|nr:restriction endonuclease subunit S [Mongoliitalea daihaiensis]UJP64804.1 restriction endonuclease subunit S [Mongoliitalea daihaiensis]
MNKLAVQKYPAYKDSGVDWLGEIPEGWELRKFKYLFREINERSDDGTEDLLSVSQYTGVTKKSDKVEEGDLLTTASTLEGYKKVYQNDLVSNIMLAWNGSLGFSPFNGITSPAYSIYRLNKGNSERFFHYLVRSQIYKSEFKRNSSGVIESRLRLYTDDFFAIWSILPSPFEQTAIANFLDDKTAKIDQAIAQKEQLIALLKERKQIIIQNAVTKGLDPNARMKDSGVEWIGEIPEHWEVKKLKYVAFIRGGQVDPKISPYKEMILIAPNHIESRSGVILYEETADQQGADSGKYLAKEGDLIYSKIRPELRKVCKTDKVCLCSADMYAIKASKDVSEDYLLFVFLGEQFNDFMINQSLRVAMPKVNRSDVINYPIVFPPFEEQRRIIKYIETQSAKTDQAISLQQNQIDKLKEYKATLIDSAVTGKIKVE